MSRLRYEKPCLETRHMSPDSITESDSTSLRTALKLVWKNVPKNQKKCFLVVGLLNFGRLVRRNILNTRRFDRSLTVSSPLMHPCEYVTKPVY